MYRRKYNLQSNEKKYAIQRIVAAVDIVAQEEVIVKGGLPTDFEQLQQIKELSMHCAQSGYIQANCSRGGSNRVNACRVKFSFVSPSPTTMTGALTGFTFSSRWKISLAISHNLQTCETRTYH